MSIGPIGYREPKHPTVAANFLIEYRADGFRWEAKEGGQFEGGHATMTDCEKSALRYWESRPEFWAI